MVTVLLGMSNVEQMADNLAYMKDFTHLSASEKEVTAKAQEELSKIDIIPCTTCDYCAKVCPKEIGILRSFTAMNMMIIYGDQAKAKQQENWLVTRHGKQQASQCI